MQYSNVTVIDLQLLRKEQCEREKGEEVFEER